MFIKRFEKIASSTLSRRLMAQKLAPNKYKKEIRLLRERFKKSRNPTSVSEQVLDIKKSLNSTNQAQEQLKDMLGKGWSPVHAHKDAISLQKKIDGQKVFTRVFSPEYLEFHKKITAPKLNKALSQIVKDRIQTLKRVNKLRRSGSTVKLMIPNIREDKSIKSIINKDNKVWETLSLPDMPLSL